MSQIATHAIEYGLVLSVVLSALLLAVLRLNAEILLHGYPPDIRAKWGPMTACTKRQRLVAGGILFLAVVAVVVYSLATLPAASRVMTFTSAFAYFGTMFGIWNVFDCVLLDWSLVYWQPRFVVLPGTEGMAGYRSYWFHFRGFLIGIPLVLAASAVLAVVLSFVARADFFRIPFTG